MAPAVSEKVPGNVAKRILQRTGSGYSAARLTDGLKTLLHTDAEQRRETAGVDVMDELVRGAGKRLR